MTYLKFIFLIVGILLITLTKTNYVKRVGTNNSLPYTKSEQNQLHMGYGCLALAVVFVIFFN